MVEIKTLDADLHVIERYRNVNVQQLPSLYGVCNNKHGELDLISEIFIMTTKWLNSCGKFKTSLDLVTNKKLFLLIIVLC